MEAAYSTRLENHYKESLPTFRQFFEMTTSDQLQKIIRATTREKIESVSCEVFGLATYFQKSSDPHDIVFLEKINELQQKIMDKYNVHVGKENKVHTISELNIHSEKKYIDALNKFNDQLFTTYHELSTFDAEQKCFGNLANEMMCMHLAGKGNAIAYLCLALTSSNFIYFNCPPLEDLPETRDYLQMAASLGNVNATYYLGLASKDREQQIQYITQAADLGHIGALVQAGLLYKSKGEMDKAIHYLKIAFEHASDKAPIAQTLSELYMDLAQDWKSKVQNLEQPGKSSLLSKRPSTSQLWNSGM
jgi:hypothetical protein